MQQWCLNGYVENMMLFQKNLKTTSLQINLLLMASDDSIVVQNFDENG